jgi:hypothetical protein
MKNVRVLAALAGLCAVLATGCIIVSGQIFAHYDLPNPFTIDGADGFERELVDLNTIDEYDEHKDKLKGLSDLAVIGKFTNENGPGGIVEVYITAGNTSLADPAAIRAGAVKLWGPGTIGATGSSVVIGWDESAALFNAAGKKILIDEALGDGEFTIYTIGSPNVDNTIRVDGGALILTLSAGM